MQLPEFPFYCARHPKNRHHIIVGLVKDCLGGLKIVCHRAESVVESWPLLEFVGNPGHMSWKVTISHPGNPRCEHAVNILQMDLVVAT